MAQGRWSASTNTWGGTARPVSSDVRLRKGIALTRSLSSSLCELLSEHPYVMPKSMQGSDEHGLYYSFMRRFRGVPWSTCLAEKPLSVNLNYLRDVSFALEFAHDKGVLHCDIRPANIICGYYGDTKLVGWTSAILLSELTAGKVTALSTWTGGDVAYMPPELANRNFLAVGIHTDIYLLGATLFEIITGLVAHSGQTAEDTLRNACENLILPSLQESELLRIALKAMSTNPAERHKSVRLFHDSLEAAIDHIN